MIDTRTQLPTGPGPPPARRWWPRRTRFDGSAKLVTRRFYDERGPRTLLLDPGAAQILAWVLAGGPGLLAIWLGASVAWPWLFTTALPFLHVVPRRALRRRVTRWLDRYEPSTSAPARAGTQSHTRSA